MKENSIIKFDNLNGHFLQPVSYYVKEFNKSFFMGMHNHPQFEFMYAYKGDFHVEVLHSPSENNNQVSSYVVKQGSFVFIDANVFHRLRIHSDNVWLYNIEFVPIHYSDVPHDANSILAVNFAALFANTGLKHLFNQQNTLLIYPDTSNVDTCFKNLMNILSKPLNTIEDNCYMQSELVMFLTAIAKSIRMYSESNLSHIKQSILYIKQNLRSKITLGEIADHVGLNKIYLCNLFKKYTGKTILQTINSLRISKALQLLRDSNIPATAIPEHVGFTSYQQMFYEFKKILGLSPTECRNAFLSDELDFWDKHYRSYSIRINEEDFSFDDETYFASNYKGVGENARSKLNTKIQ